MSKIPANPELPGSIAAVGIRAAGEAAGAALDANPATQGMGAFARLAGSIAAEPGKAVVNWLTIQLEAKFGSSRERIKEAAGENPALSDDPEVRNLLQAAIPAIRDAETEEKQRLIEDIVSGAMVSAKSAGAWAEAHRAVEMIAALSPTEAVMFACCLREWPRSSDGTLVPGERWTFSREHLLSLTSGVTQWIRERDVKNLVDKGLIWSAAQNSHFTQRAHWLGEWILRNPVPRDEEPPAEG